MNLLTTFRINATGAGTSPLECYSIVASRDGIFALTIIDNSFSISSDNAKWTKFLQYYLDQSDKINNNLTLSVTQKNDKLKKMMLTGLKSLGLENNIALFQGTATNSMSNTTPSVPLANINWYRILMDSNGNLKPTINCN